MPNLDHDPKNPTDLLDRPIAAGDIVAWGTTYGRSPAIAVCRIERIRFIRKKYGERWGDNEECTQDQAEDYQLVLKPIKSTGYVTDSEYVPGGFFENGEQKFFRSVPPKNKTIKLVKNVVKIGQPL